MLISAERVIEVCNQRAIELLERDKPLLLLVCPMFVPFGGLQNSITQRWTGTR